ncbi:hypothetical protein SDC9_145164 [bioreactor metagenome]|uniref:Uncharacterized protein n=1 Tax=bioreactor metagenome TaxID=1076179 RepID=A0A645EB32_9ZZZZ
MRCRGGTSRWRIAFHGRSACGCRVFCGRPFAGRCLDFVAAFLHQNNAADHGRRIASRIVVHSVQWEAQHRQGVAIALALDHDMPDGLACDWIEIDCAIVLPGVEQPVVLVRAGYASRIVGFVLLDLLADLVGQALGHEVDCAIKDPTCCAIPIQGQDSPLRQHAADCAHQPLDERHCRGGGEALSRAALQVVSYGHLVCLPDDCSKCLYALKGAGARFGALPAQKGAQRFQDGVFTPQEGQRIGRSNGLQQDQGELLVGQVIAFSGWRKANLVFGGVRLRQGTRER